MIDERWKIYCGRRRLDVQRAKRILRCRSEATLLPGSTTLSVCGLVPLNIDGHKHPRTNYPHPHIENSQKSRAACSMSRYLCRCIPDGLLTTNFRPTQPSTLSGMEDEYRPKCGDALQLGSKGRHGSFQLWINVWVAGKPGWSLVVSECLRGELPIKRCTNTCALFYCMPPNLWHGITTAAFTSHQPDWPRAFFCG